MAALFIVLLILCGLHFVYEGILLPSIRLILRYKLFAIRDDLRDLRILHRDNVDQGLFDHLEGSINNSIRILFRTDLATIIRIERSLRHLPALREEIDARSDWLHRQLEISAIAELKGIHSRRLNIFAIAVLANNGGLIAYFLPLIFVGLILAFLISLVTSFIQKYIHSILESAEKIVLVPEHQLDDLVPNEVAP